VKILIYSDNKWVIESIEKYIDFDYELLENVDLESLNQRIDYIFVDMQVKNNGGPSIIRELKRDKITKNTPIALIADREADEFQAKRVGADFFAVKPVSKTKLNEYKKILKILYQIQKIKNFKTQNFLKKKFNLSNYSKAKILKESYLFLDWYLPANKLIIQKRYLKKNFKKIIDDLYLNLKIKHKVFVHRDFHVSNMMFYKNKIALIDSQDAVLGNPAYDLASLIDDVRIKTSNSFKSNILKVFLSKFKYKNESQFINDFEILSVLRNLKIIGIFTRLANRDKKKKYLKLIPYAWKLIDNRMKNNSNFNDLINFLKENPKIKKK